MDAEKSAKSSDYGTGFGFSNERRPLFFRRTKGTSQARTARSLITNFKGSCLNKSLRFGLTRKQEVNMKDKSSQGIVLDEKSHEQPKDKDRAQKAHKSEPGHMPQQPVEKDDELQPLRERSGF
jgi:hypothetical protein